MVPVRVQLTGHVLPSLDKSKVAIYGERIGAPEGPGTCSYLQDDWDAEQIGLCGLRLVAFTTLFLGTLGPFCLLLWLESCSHLLSLTGFVRAGGICSLPLPIHTEPGSEQVRYKRLFQKKHE